MKNYTSFINFLCLIITFFLSTITFAATITVTSSANSGAGTLRQAVLDANNGDTIEFNGSVTSITLSSNIEINKNITIDGPGADVLTISGGGTSGIFHINTSGSVVIRDVLLTNGKAGEESINFGGINFGGGGAIFHESGTVQLINCEVTNNNADGGGAPFEYGGALTVLDDMSILNCTFTGNSITGSAIVGGVMAIITSPTVSITSCTFFNNSSVNEAGAIRVEGFSTGTPVVTITNCTFFNNASGGNNTWGQDIDASNNGYTLILHNNIFDRSSADAHVSVRAIGTSTQTSRGGNIFRDTPTFSTIATDDVNQGTNSSGIASSLAANNTLNGVRTLSITGSGSLAKDNGTTGFDETTTDARGAERNGTIDSGAYEFWVAQGILPVELISFTAILDNGVVKLTWETATEVNNYGFQVERRNLRGLDTQPADGNLEGYTAIGFVQGQGNSNSLKEYEFVDGNPPSGDLQYRLKQIDTDGTYEYYSLIAEVDGTITSLNDERLPEQFYLSQNYPNPFNPSTTIKYQIAIDKLQINSLDQYQNVTLKVYDILGNEVATPVDERQTPGNYSVEFDAGKLSSGLYLYKIVIGNFVQSKKMILIK